MTRNAQTKQFPNPTLLENPEEYFFTYDLGCAASLVSSGYELLSLDRQNPKKILFIFKRTGDTDKVVDDYYSDRLRVNARTFFDNIRMLKNRIYSGL